MGGVILLWLTIVPWAYAIDVNITSFWKKDFGFVVVCSWETLPNDTLQSVRLYNDERQLVVYRPEKHGPSRSEVFHAPLYDIYVNCSLTKDRGQQGYCEMDLGIHDPGLKGFNHSCEVSGERPTFFIGMQYYPVKMFVPPTNASIVSTVQNESSPPRVMLNCSTAGLPLPTLQWTIGNDKVEADFTDHIWNKTSKLWHIWSYLSYTKNSDAKVKCTPETATSREFVAGVSAEYNSATRYFGTKLLFVTIMTMICR